MTDELRPCPWPECRSEVLRIAVAWATEYYICCPVCEASGPVAQSEEEAVRLWNNREGFDSAGAERSNGDE